MEKLTVVVAAAGQGKRMGLGFNKVFAETEGLPIIVQNLKNLSKVNNLGEVYIVVGLGEEKVMQDVLYQYALEYFPNVSWQLVIGGKERQDSVANALAKVTDEKGWVAVHDGARPYATADIFARVWAAARETGAAIAAVPCKDTIKMVDTKEQVIDTPSRAKLRAVQTPQIFSLELLRKAYARLEQNPEAVTDDASLVERLGTKVQVVLGDYNNIKITTQGDLPVKKESTMHVGSGYDVHKLVPARKLILCGVEIPYELGLDGHSDADVALHALMDALLGAAGLGDIGKFFPDNDPSYKDADSRKLLASVLKTLDNEGWKVNNVDVTIIAQQPKLSPFREDMKAMLMGDLKLPKDAVNLKATTTEHLGFTGRGEGIASEAVVSIVKK